MHGKSSSRKFIAIENIYKYLQVYTQDKYKYQSTLPMIDVNLKFIQFIKHVRQWQIQRGAFVANANPPPSPLWREPCILK